MTFRHSRRASVCVGLLLLSTACTDPKPGPEPEPEPKPAPSRPPNIHFLIDTSGSMRELPQVVNSDHEEFFNITVNGCNNPRLDAFSNSQGWVSAIVYPRPDRGTGHGADNGFPDLFSDDTFYGYMSWDNSNAPPPQWNSREEVCQSQVADWSGAGATEYSRCLSCLDTKGYYKAPWAEADPSLPTNLGFILWGRFLNFNPPKYVTLRAALKRTLDALGGPELGGVRVGFSSFISGSTASTMGERLNPICAQSSLRLPGRLPQRRAHVASTQRVLGLPDLRHHPRDGWRADRRLAPRAHCQPAACAQWRSCLLPGLPAVRLGLRLSA